MVISSLAILLKPVPMISSSSSVWGVIPDEEFEFDLNYVNISYVFGSTEYNATGIRFANATVVEQGNTISMKVNGIEGTNITYMLTYGPLIENHYRLSNNTESELKELFRLPLKFALQEVELDEIKRGFTGIDYLIVSNGSETWQLFDNYDGPIFLAIMEEIFSSNGEVQLEAFTELNESTNECVFDWYVNGTYIDEVEEDDFLFYYNLKMAYELSSGILFGMRMDFLVNGFHGNKSMDVILKSEVVRSGYVLADFRLPTGEGIELSDIISSLFPGYRWFLLPIIIIPIFIIQKKKKENEN